MIRSFMDSNVWDSEFGFINQQEHFEKVWKDVENTTRLYMKDYTEHIRSNYESEDINQAILKHFKTLIDKHETVHEKYYELFNMEAMEEYEEDVDGFKGSILSRQCTVIQKTLNSKSEALRDWKFKFKISTPQELYDTFYNIMTFAEEYEEKCKDLADETGLVEFDRLSDTGLDKLEEDGCYLQGVIGTGILSTVLNALYPHRFPGQFKQGLYALYFLSERKTIDMGSGSSEFLMVKDDMKSKTGIIETEHNYYYPYHVFVLYTQKIHNLINEYIYEHYGIRFPTEYRYVLTNDFYLFVTMCNKESIATLSGNDDINKFNQSV
ncbi:hypothetical protein [Isachenkonia alkalipeptolytica]|uniref:Uncharacterized protein n=1 Tax=Isachenkonia alkalipeptolytica TaxID=2565777 RepID=A0AA43XKT3_9CLOT|nr:hypothetical protein [Isachenkonia alkalipeptolytica]NBG87680.1 hypothetical protein [Isachenkonia alkalipeptolytica]